jgi:membrane-bound serine protease (ClpP class)
MRYTMRIVRPLAALVLAAAGLTSIVAAQSQTDATRPVVYRVPVTGVVEMGLAPFVERAVAEASAAGAVAVVLDIDTPGGRVDAAERIADALNDSPVPVYAFVNRRAISAGALIALAAQKVYMRPGATMGAATPVLGDGSEASEKMVSFMRAEFRSLADQRGLDPTIAEAMVDPSIDVPGAPEGKLLTLSTADAVGVGYAEAVEDWDGLMATLGLSNPNVVDMRANWAERVVRFLSHPVVAPFLLSIGFLGLIIEIKTPSFGLAGAAGITALTAFFGSHLLLGLAGWETVLLLVAGIILLLVEAFVIPGFGIAGLVGLAAVVGSVILTIAGSAPTAADLRIAGFVVISTFVLTGFTLWAMIRHLPYDRRASFLFLQAATRSDEGYVAAVARADLEGMEGVAVTDLRPAGTARFGDERLDVVAGSGWVSAGTPVRVTHSEGYRLVVEAVATQAEQA